MQSTVFGSPNGTIGSPGRNLNTSGYSDPRGRELQGAENELKEIEQMINMTKADINSSQTQVKNGITMRRKRELEEKLENLEKERNALRGKVRLGLSK